MLVLSLPRAALSLVRPGAAASLGRVPQGGPGTPSVKPLLCLLSCSSPQTGSWTVFLHFLGLACYYGVIFHLKVLVFLASNSVVFLLLSEDRSAADRVVVLSHTQMFPFIIHPDQS